MPNIQKNSLVRHGKSSDNKQAEGELLKAKEFCNVNIEATEIDREIPGFIFSIRE